MTLTSSKSAVVRARVADQILADLRRRILRGDLADGEKLPAERDLAAAYGVSGATVREAVRVLSSTGLVDVRHGSGSYVNARPDVLVATMLTAVVGVERSGLLDLLDVAQGLNLRAVQLAAERGTNAELLALREAAAEVPASGTDEIVAGLKRFFTTLWGMAHNPLLAALSTFLMAAQLGLAVDLSDGRPDLWRSAARQLADGRTALVEALAARDSQRAAAMMHEYHARLLTVIDSLPKTTTLRADDPELAVYVSGFLTDRMTAA